MPNTSIPVVDMPNPDQTHPSDEALERFLLNQLQEQEADWVEEHMLVCGQCLDRVQILEEEIADLKRALQETAAQAKTKRTAFQPRSVFLAAAAVLVLMIAVPLLLEKSRPISELDLVALRGNRSIPTATIGQPIRLNLDCQDLADHPINVQVVDSAGREVWQGSAEVRDEKASVEMSGVHGTGQYWVRLFSKGEGKASQLLREYGFVSKP